MTWLGWLNFALLQWWGVRLARVVTLAAEGRDGWALLGPVLPLSGWGGLRYVGRPRVLFMLRSGGASCC